MINGVPNPEPIDELKSLAMIDTNQEWHF